jgi:hypothetical protein
MNVEDRVRETLRRQAERVTVSPDAWDRIEARTEARTFAPWQLATLGAVAAAIVVLAAVVGVRSLGGDDPQQVAVGGPSPTAGDEPATTTTAPPTTTSAPVTTAPATTAAPPPTTTAPPTTAAPSTTDTTAPPTTSTTAPDGPVLDPSDRVGWGRLGPIVAGMTVEELEAATGRDWDVTSGTEGSPCAYISAAGMAVGVNVMVDGDTVVRIDLQELPTDAGDVSPGFPTEEGVDIGSTEREVADAYGDRVEVRPHPYLGDGHCLVVGPGPGQDPAMRTIFETDGQRVTSFRTGVAEAVELIEGCS